MFIATDRPVGLLLVNPFTKDALLVWIQNQVGNETNGVKRLHSPPRYAW